MIMELKKNGRLEANKRKMGVSGHDGELLTHLRKALVQGCQSIAPTPKTPPTPHPTHTVIAVILCQCPDAPGGIQATLKSTWSQISERQGRKDPRCFLAIASISPQPPGGVSESRGRVRSVVTSTRCAPLTQITSAVDKPHRPESSGPTAQSHTHTCFHSWAVQGEMHPGKCCQVFHLLFMSLSLLFIVCMLSPLWSSSVGCLLWGIRQI